MSVSPFPLSFPVTKFALCDLAPYRREALGVAASGRDPSVDRGASGWTGSWTTNPLTTTELGQWEAFEGALHGAQRYFLGWDTAHEYPLAYMPQGFGSLTRWDGSAFDTTGVLSDPQSRKVARDGADLYDLPAGLTLSPGDHVSFQWADNPAVATDFTGGAGGWTVGDGTFAASGGAMLLTPTGANAKITKTFTEVPGASFSRIYLDIERVTTGGTYNGSIEWTDSANVSHGAPGAFRLPGAVGRYRQVIDMSAVAGATWTGSGVKVLSIFPVSTAAGSFRIWTARLENAASEAQRYSLHKLINPTPLVADAFGALSGAWLNFEMIAAVPTGAIARLWRAPAKFKKIEFTSPKSADGGSRPAVVTLKGLSVPT